MIDSFVGEYRFLSNFYPCRVQYLGESYRTSEHAFQAAKAADSKGRERIINAPTPADAKRIGRTIKLRADWDGVKLRVMEECLRAKFRNSDLAQMLLNTGDAELVEGNTWGDTYWGKCKGKGQNHLGRLLMKIRSELK